MTSSEWISAVELASLAGIERQSANRICRKICAKPESRWDGAALIVRSVEGRGGKSGMQYQVRLDSLPEDLQHHWNASRGPLERPSKHVQSTDLSRKWDWFREVFAEVLAHPAGSRARGAAKAELVGKEVRDWNGRRIVLKRSTIDRWINDYEAHGIRGLTRQSRADKGKRRIIVSRQWDKLVRGRLDEDVMQRIAGILHEYIAGLMQANTARKLALPLAAKKLEDVTRKFGYRPNDPATLRKACKISIKTYSRFLDHKKVHRFRRDRKASDDALPRNRRTIAGLRPMEIVVADWHHCNVLVERSDGTTATPKLIGFMDMATRRVWCELAFFEERGGPRNTHGLKALANMAAHPEFGMPENLYLDNGKEFLFGDYMADALRLVRGGLTADDKHPIIRSLPYNAPAKPIEAWFGHFENTYLHHVQGYVGDDRMNPKREQLGKLPAPFGAFDQFAETFHKLLTIYETVPVSGQLGGISPRQAFGQHVDDGWAATVAERDDILFACCERKSRKLTQHVFPYDKGLWGCDELETFHGDLVFVYLPKWGISFDQLRVEDQYGQLIGYASRLEEFEFGDQRGAKEAAGRKASTNRSLTKMSKSVPAVDVVRDLDALAAEHAPVVPNEPNGVISLDRHRYSKVGALLPEEQPTQDDEDRAAREEAEFRQLQREIINRRPKKGTGS